MLNKINNFLLQEIHKHVTFTIIFINRKFIVEHIYVFICIYIRFISALLLEIIELNSHTDRVIFVSLSGSASHYLHDAGRLSGIMYWTSMYELIRSDVGPN